MYYWYPNYILNMIPFIDFYQYHDILFAIISLPFSKQMLVSDEDRLEKYENTAFLDFANIFQFEIVECVEFFHLFVSLTLPCYFQAELVIKSVWMLHA